MQVRQQCPDPEQRDRNLSGQPLVTMGGGALPLPMPTQPATLTATRVATKATSTFFIGIPLSFTPRDAHFVPRCTVGRPRKPMVHRLRRQRGTSKGTVSLGTQLRGMRSKTCQKAAADRPPGTHHSPSISGLNSSSSALRLDRLLRLRWLTARCPTPVSPGLQPTTAVGGLCSTAKYRGLGPNRVIRARLRLGRSPIHVRSTPIATENSRRTCSSRAGPGGVPS